MLYNVQRVDKKLSTLDHALYRGNVCLLQILVKEQKETHKCHMVNASITISMILALPACEFQVIKLCFVAGEVKIAIICSWLKFKKN